MGDVALSIFGKYSVHQMFIKEFAWGRNAYDSSYKDEEKIPSSLSQDRDFPKKFCQD